MPRAGGAPPPDLNLRRILLVGLLVLALDLLSKVIVRAELPVHGPVVSLLGETIRLTHVRNTGSAFSLFQGGRFFFIGFSVISIALIAALARSPRYRTPAYATALGMILGGAFGNLIDRIAFGHVTDWIDIGVPSYRWPTFNVADMGITIGVALLAVLMIRQSREETPPPEVDAV